jgi:hypothetical protein
MNGKKAKLLRKMARAMAVDAMQRDAGLNIQAYYKRSYKLLKKNAA